jgi:hypothetical protein
VPVSVPSVGVAFNMSPAAARRCGSRLSSNAATRWASNLGACCTGFFGGVGTLASGLVGACFFASSFFSASAIWSIFGSGSFFSRCSAGRGSGKGGGSAEAVVISGFSTTFGAGCFAGFGSATLSTSGFGVSALGAVLEPATICE